MKYGRGLVGRVAQPDGEAVHRVHHLDASKLRAAAVLVVPVGASVDAGGDLAVVTAGPDVCRAYRVHAVERLAVGGQVGPGGSVAEERDSRERASAAGVM